MLNRLKSLAVAIAAAVALRVKALWQSEPTRVVSALVAVVMFVAVKVGVVIDETEVWKALVLMLPILLGGEGIRAKVSPAPPANIGPASDDLLPPEVTSGR